MKAAILSLLATSLSALAAPTRRADPIQFYGLSIRSGSDIQYSSINANGTYFYLDAPTSVYTPPNVGPASNQTDTLFVTANTGTLSLSVVVPGGQEVYVGPKGALRFTQPHSAQKPEGSLVTGFSVASPNLRFQGNDFLACPTAKDKNVYKIFAASVVKNAAADCLGFAFYVDQVDAAVEAWEYV